jgi:hypothetical protein
MNEELRLKWQYRRLMIETPIALFLVFYSAQEYGWGFTLHWLRFFAVNVSILVALTKKLKWM